MLSEIERRELLTELAANSDVTNVVIGELLAIAQLMTEAMVKLTLSNESSEKELVRMKCRAEGAASVVSAFKTRLLSLKAKQKR